MLERIVVLGAGQASVQAIDTLRRRGFTGSITVIGDEPHLPYQRPPLSKAYLAGTLRPERLFLRRDRYFADHAVETRLGCRATRIDRPAQRVDTDDGCHVEYDALLIVTGSRPRRLYIPGSNLDHVHYLRTIGDAARIREDIAPGRRIVIVGGGYIGLEVAATCRALGLEVTVLEMTDRVMQRVVCANMSAFYEAKHAANGVRTVCNAHVRAFAAYSGSRRVRAVICEDGSEYPADLVVIGIGVMAGDEIASAAGLDCSNGVVVDASCRTIDPSIYAAGDCTNQPSLHYRTRLRLESVDNAFEQATTAALNMLGEPAVHDNVPSFWSEQFDLNTAIVGLSAGHDAAIVRGSIAAGSFSVCYLRGGELVAVHAVNSPKDQMAARKLVAARLRPNVEKLADPSIPLNDTAN